MKEPKLYTGTKEYCVGIETSHLWMIGDEIITEHIEHPKSRPRAAPKRTKARIVDIVGAPTNVKAFVLRTPDFKTKELAANQMGPTFRKVRPDEAERNQDAFSLIRYQIRTAILSNTSILMPTPRRLARHDVGRVPSSLKHLIVDHTIKLMRTHLNYEVTDQPLIDDALNEIRDGFAKEPPLPPLDLTVRITRADLITMAGDGWLSHDMSSYLSLHITN